MGLANWIFGKRSIARHGATVIGTGYYTFDIVGEASYQDALDRICGGRNADGHELECKASLIEEPKNPHDRNAVKVVIAGRTVGYLSRRDAVAFKQALVSEGLSGRPVNVDAIVIGGWDRGSRGQGHYGVKLDMTMPPEFA